MLYFGLLIIHGLVYCSMESRTRSEYSICISSRLTPSFVTSQRARTDSLDLQGSFSSFPEYVVFRCLHRVAADSNNHHNHHRLNNWHNRNRYPLIRHCPNRYLPSRPGFFRFCRSCPCPCLWMTSVSRPSIGSHSGRTMLVAAKNSMLQVKEPSFVCYFF